MCVTGIRNVSFSENVVYLRNGWLPMGIVCQQEANLVTTDLVTTADYCHTWDHITKRGINKIGNCIFYHARKYLKDWEYIILLSDPGRNKKTGIHTYQWCPCSTFRLKTWESSYDKGHAWNANGSKIKWEYT